jgi:putative transcriptional regulator
MKSRTKKPDPEMQAFADSLIGSIREMKAGTAAKRTGVRVSPVVAARLKAELSQAQFAELLGISVRTLQKWEQGEREPSGAAKTLIRIAEQHPDVLATLVA